MEAIATYERDNFWPPNFFAKQYVKCTSHDCKANNVYDFDSVMHYGPLLQGTNITIITPKRRCNNKACRIGQRERMSFLDKKDIISLYGCGNDIVLYYKPIYYCLFTCFSVSIAIQDFVKLYKCHNKSHMICRFYTIEYK